MKVGINTRTRMVNRQMRAAIRYAEAAVPGSQVTLRRVWSGGQWEYWLERNRYFASEYALLAVYSPTDHTLEYSPLKTPINLWAWVEDHAMRVEVDLHRRAEGWLKGVLA